MLEAGHVGAGLQHDLCAPNHRPAGSRNVDRGRSHRDDDRSLGALTGDVGDLELERVGRVLVGKGRLPGRAAGGGVGETAFVGFVALDHADRPDGREAGPGNGGLQVDRRARGRGPVLRDEGDRRFRGREHAVQQLNLPQGRVVQTDVAQPPRRLRAQLHPDDVVGNVRNEVDPAAVLHARQLAAAAVDDRVSGPVGVRIGPAREPLDQRPCVGAGDLPQNRETLLHLRPARARQRGAQVQPAALAAPVRHRLRLHRQRRVVAQRRQAGRVA